MDGWVTAFAISCLSLSLFVWIVSLIVSLIVSFNGLSFVLGWTKNEERRTKNEERKEGRKEGKKKKAIEAIFIGWILIGENKVIHY
jgi:membrane protein implicated in regulation of membrane protease activity